MIALPAMQHIAAIVNGAAGGGRCAQRFEPFRDRLQRSFDTVQVLSTTAPGHAPVLARMAVDAGAEAVMWVQEEPANMGAWSFVRWRLQYLLGKEGRDRVVTYAGRKPSAAPAGGSMRLHRKRQQRLLDIAMGERIE